LRTEWVAAAGKRIKENSEDKIRRDAEALDENVARVVEAVKERELPARWKNLRGASAGGSRRGARRADPALVQDAVGRGGSGLLERGT